MKKKQLIIIILSTLSVLGIIFLQINWIKNVIDVQQKQFETELNSSISNIKINILQRAAKNFGYNPNAIDYENVTIQNIILDQQLSQIPSEEIEKIIKKNLNEKKINLDFDFAIIKNGIFLTNSKNYKHDNITLSYSYPLNQDQNITLILYIKNTHFYNIQKAGWNIVASVIFTIIILYAFILTNITLIKLRKVTDSTTDFFNNMTHEFKTPIATINLAVDTLKNEKVINDRASQLLYISMIKEENNRMLKLIQRILESAKSEESAFMMDFSPININNIIQKATDSVELMLSNIDGQLQLLFNTTYDIVLGDEVHLTNIFNNLLDNAIKYRSKNHKLHVIIETTMSNNQICIKITDNGVGITKEAQKNIFKRFYRVTSGNIHNTKGFGLGLSYVKTVVENHNGKITVSSTPNKGTTFCITLPTFEQ
jgi:two-component system phosphate regulon sensor histidine kinase PhoR